MAQIQSWGFVLQTWSLHQKIRLLKQLTVRDIETRYRGSGLGIFWAVATPLLNLAVFTFVFGTVFQSRWAGSQSTGSTYEFAVILFIGLITFQFLADILNRAPSLIRSQPGYVTKIQFPLELMPLAVVLGSNFNLLIGILITLPFIYFVFGSIPLMALMLPVVLFPFAVLCAGLSWLIASLGVFIRDISQVVPSITTAMLFLSPVFFPLDVLPQWVLPFIYANPITVPVDQVRDILVFGIFPDLRILAIYTVTSSAIASVGYFWFKATQKGFADVI